MAITQAGNIAYINQNTLLNSQMQAANLNAANTQTAINMKDFSEKIQETLEVRATEGSKAIDKDTENANKQEYEGNSNETPQKAQKKEHLNIYGEDGILDIEV